MIDLSPAAAAVLDAFESSWDADPFEIDIKALAAALRAVADAVAPTAAPHRRKIRAELLAIAAELEGR